MGERENIIKEKSYKFALRVVELVKRLPKKTEGFVIGSQLLNSGTSIGANVEEGSARKAYKRISPVFIHSNGFPY